MPRQSSSQQGMPAGFTMTIILVRLSLSRNRQACSPLERSRVIVAPRGNQGVARRCA